MKGIKTIGILLGALCFLFTHGAVAADFTIGIMQDKAGEAAKYGPLVEFFKAKGIDLKLKGYRNYPDAAIKFAGGDVDAMFAGSGVAGTMIIKNVAYPLVRPVSKDGWSTYWAVVLAPKGSPKFTSDPAYFKDKKIICSSLASSGEFFARSFLGKDRELLKAGSHGIAIKALAKGVADIAIVKNRVWDSMKSNFPGIEQVGQDNGENPNGTLIISYKTNNEQVAKVKNILLDLENDGSSEAKAVKSKLQITGYIPTTEEDFGHTLQLLKEAGVTKDFNFSYK